MTENIRISAVSADSWSRRSVNFALGSVLIGALVAAIYSGILAKLVTDWWRIAWAVLTRGQTYCATAST